jgi:hypothetical protein
LLQNHGQYGQPVNHDRGRVGVAVFGCVL